MAESQTKSLQLVVLVSGRGTNLQAIIGAQKTCQIQSRIRAVISNRSDALALQRAQDAGIHSVVVPSKNKSPAQFFEDLLHTVKTLNPDLIILAGFMKVLPAEFVHTFENKIINIHPSLLPCFKGLQAQQQALDAGVKITGCTVHFVDTGCDTGPIILQTAEPVKPDDTVETLSQRLLEKEHHTLIQAIKLIENNKVILQENKTLLREAT